MNRPSIPKGTRDFLPIEMVRRNYIFNTIRTVFKKYGFLPIETPAMEKLTTLTGKYGEEGDQLIFKILDRGNKLASRLKNFSELEKGQGKIEHALCEQALRYDLTVPFARYVVQHQNDITFPFKRYQIQPVWRADRPQKGRYREFYQCDADVIGTDSLLNELEIIQMIDEVLNLLGIEDFTIKLNNRKVLTGIAEVVGEKDRITDITMALDKLDKIGEDGVINELRERGLGESSIETIKPLFSLSGDNYTLIEEMRAMLEKSPIGIKGLEEVSFIMDLISSLGLKKAALQFDATLARGLNYYTGAIFEVVVNDASFGAICGGGRYDDLTGLFGLKDISGVGISFGADRIYDVLNELDIFPDLKSETSQVLFLNFGADEATHCLKLLQKVRAAGINSELYPTAVKLKKQMNYADGKGVQFVVIVGSDEMKTDRVKVKEMTTGEQLEMTVEELINRVKG
jgi:histidyl-tRNA synthetase